MPRTLSLRCISSLRISPIVFASCVLLFSCNSVKKVPAEQEQFYNSSTDNSGKVKYIDSLVQQLVIKKKTAGVEFGIQIGNSEPYIQGYGYADLENNLKVTPSTVFRIASITKPFTATAVMLLIDRGLLSLTDPLSKFFPEYPNGQDITVYQLLSHTSGIPNYWDGVLPADAPSSFPMCPEPHKYLQKMKTASLFAPGTMYSYSNSGYILLGEIIERVSKKPYASFLTDNIIRPIGMMNTTIEAPFSDAPDWADGYIIDSTRNTGFSLPSPTYAYMPFSAGALRSNTRDMLKFSNAFFNGNVLKTELVKKMTVDATVKSGKPVYEANFFPPGFKPFQLPEHVKKPGYGLGFSLMETYNEPVIWHSGGIQGFNSIFVYIPKTKISLAILANTENGIMPAFEEIIRVIISMT